MARGLKGEAHPMYEHGGRVGKGTKEWFAWARMIARCKYPCVERYARYGGRGIKVCEQWAESFPQFLQDVGEAPSPEHQLDRIDNDGNYEPGNVRWATRSENVRNSSKARYLELDGVRKTIGDWAAELGINRQTIQMRLDSYGWPVEKALRKEVRHRFR